MKYADCSRTLKPPACAAVWAANVWSAPASAAKAQPCAGTIEQRASRRTPSSRGIVRTHRLDAVPMTKVQEGGLALHRTDEAGPAQMGSSLAVGHSGRQLDTTAIRDHLRHFLASDASPRRPRALR